ncbi:MAG: DoxX family membrane protein [Actinomycetota bacterium]|nr:DoxX family membrane protein [Actinomycetota bacterium]
MVDAGLLLLRLALAAALLAHGEHNLSRWFGWRGSRRAAALVDPNASLPAAGHPHSVAGPMAGPAEVLAAVVLGLGLLTPFGAATVIGLAVVVCRRAYWRSGFAFEPEQQFLLGAAAVATVLAFTGPGRVSVDHALGLRPGGLVWGVVALAFGLVGAAAVVAGGDRLEDPHER